MEQENIDNLLDDESKANQKKKTRIFIGLAILLIVVIIIIIIIIATGKSGDDEKDKINPPSPSDQSSYKPTSFEIVKFPEGIIYNGKGIFSKTGKILLSYTKQNDNNTYIGVMNSDGTNLKQLWGGIWKSYYHSNGFRLMPFDDNKKILTGDYILECSPNIDECSSSCELLPVIYPPEVVNMEGVTRVWSEIIISPDEHIGWSTLSDVYENVNFIAKLQKNNANYTMTNVQIISTIGLIEYEDKSKGIIKPTSIRGGEIKQFVNGGEALTLAGAGKQGLVKSVFQDLLTDDHYQITYYPGYEETTIISPDGKLGLVMTTRFSPKTSSEILGIMPRPFSSYTLSKMSMFVYIYGIINVRNNRAGNIGPAAINITESIKNEAYMGYDLHEEGWAFNSPISWHPNSKKAMFSETAQNGDEKGKKRIRIVNFDNYIPSEIIKNKKTPDNIPYAKGLDALKEPFEKEFNGYFQGKEGIIIFNRTKETTRSEYKNYSEDGKTYYNGFEQCEHGSQTVGRFISDVTMTGENEGKMDLTLTMNINGQVIYEQDGKKMTYGYVYYKGKNITVEESYN